MAMPSGTKPQDTLKPVEVRLLSHPPFLTRIAAFVSFFFRGFPFLTVTQLNEYHDNLGYLAKSINFSVRSFTVSLF